MSIQPKEYKKPNGPFDIIGDIHGCFDELMLLLKKLGYQVNVKRPANEDFGFEADHPKGRIVVFPGDLVDRGPKIVSVLKLAMSMVYSGKALCLIGNHDDKLLRKLKGRNVQVKHGLEDSVAQLAEESADFIAAVREFLDGLACYYFLDEGRLVVAHAGWKEEMHGLNAEQVREFTLYGETTGEIDEFGLPVRLNWASEYQGQALMVYGHTPVAEAKWVNRTIDLDTGCVFGGKLTALRYPEKELVDVPALFTYYVPARPFLPQTDRAPDYVEA